METSSFIHQRQETTLSVAKREDRLAVDQGRTSRGLAVKPREGKAFSEPFSAGVKNSVKGGDGPDTATPH